MEKKLVKDQREKEREKSRSKGEKRLLIGFIWNCAAELKLLLAALLLLCFFATLLQFLPARFSLSSPCLSTTTVSTTLSPPTPPSYQILDNGVVKRSFNPYGTAAYSFILMSAYRGGANSFAVMGLASKPLHVFSRPTYTCEYQTNTTTITTPGYKILPDWGYGRVYTTVVINCTFPATSEAAKPDGGGRLLIHATTNGGFDHNLNVTDTMTAIIEPPNSWNLSYFLSPPKYDYLYCGSSLYGTLCPQRVREWIAYHVRLFGKRSHFVIHDAGGVHPEVMDVLRPWMDMGYVTLQDIRDQERFDGYYHNQFLIVNDCLHRYRFDAKWIFFFDVDEFIHLNPKFSLGSGMDWFKEYSQITIEQMPISNQLCLTEDAGKTTKKWGFEKLVYRDVKQVMRRDRKYAVQPRDVFATGVHMSQNLQGKSTHRTERMLRYFHYHGTISERREPCRHLVNETFTMLEGNPYVLDLTLRSIAPSVKTFELNTIGPRLQSTRQ